MNRIQQHHLIPGDARHGRAGFTLVEMLVATGLVVLIMSFFAQIYGTAISTMTEQKGIGNNDQRARVLNDLIRNDLKYMSYRQVGPAYGTARGLVPITPGDGPIIDHENQRGYFYLSENDPYDPTDDVLQFTIAIPAEQYDDFRVGKASELVDQASTRYQNQPYLDGGPESAPGMSRFAEVAYFLRKGVLYRHVLLLRDTNGADEQPGHLPNPNGELRRTFGREGIERLVSSGNRFNYPRLEVPEDEATDRFWNKFDYSATRYFFDADNDPNVVDLQSFLWFHGADSLSNGPTQKDQLSLGLPWNRFGHYIDRFETDPATTRNGMPREFTKRRQSDPTDPGDPLGSNSTGQFFGRLTHWETSSNLVTFPGRLPINEGTPNLIGMPTSPELTLSVNEFGQLQHQGTVLSNGSRVGEDVVLTNVESFDVEVWDPTYGGFLPLGHRNPNGREFAASQNQNVEYGPRNSGNFIFDTWHTDAYIRTSKPPYRPLKVPSANVRDWEPSDSSFSLGQAIHIGALRQNAWPDVWEAPPADDSSVPKMQSDSWVYQLIKAGETSAASAKPAFPPILGNIVIDNDAMWKCVDNRIGLASIRITIRYIDAQTRLSRQLTIVHSFAK